MQRHLGSYMTLHLKSYSDESLSDLDRDITEAFDEIYNPMVASIPKDEHGFRKGTFTVSVMWFDDSNGS